MADLLVGKASKEPFTLPLEVATQTMALHGIRGGGKTVTATVIVEQLLAQGAHTVVIDPTDVWWGLKSSLDGQSGGFPVVVIGGEHGDLPLAEEDGRTLADFAVEERIPMVLSLRHLRKAAQKRFVTAFCEQLYHRKGAQEYRQPLFLAIDEASAFVPQRVDAGAAAMVGAIEDIVRRGRASGFGICLIDQRPASVNKNVLTQLEVLVTHRITSPQDRKALGEWVDQHDTMGMKDQFLEDLASLKKGQAYFWSPALDIFSKVNVNMRSTFDSSATPKPGDDPVEPGVVAKVDLDALKSKLGATLERRRAENPDFLKKRIRELEDELHEAEKGDVELANRVQGMFHDMIGTAVDYISAALEHLKAAQLWEPGVNPDTIMPSPPPKLTVVKGEGKSSVPTEPARLKLEKRASDAFREANPAPGEGGLRDELPGVQLRVIDAMAQMQFQLGSPPMEKNVVAVLSGQSPRSSAVAKNLRELKDRELIDQDALGDWFLTEKGLAYAKHMPRRMTIEDVHDTWMNILKPAQRRMLQTLIDFYPHSIDKDQLADRSGISRTSSALGATIRDLRRYGALEENHDGYRASRLIFPEGLR